MNFLTKITPALINIYNQLLKTSSTDKIRQAAENQSLNKMNKEKLPKEIEEVLTNESVEAIETAFKEKLELSVEAALAQQDELYAEKLESSRC